MDGSTKIAVVTGGNSGIGRATAAGLAQRGMRVVIACRNPQKAEEALKWLKSKGAADVEYMHLDMSSLGGVREFAKEYLEKYSRLDVLVNNAGVLYSSRHTTEDGFEAQFGVNYLAHFLLTLLLLRALCRADCGRVIMTSSVAHRWTNLHFDDINLEKRYSLMLGYGQSKLCNLMFARELSRRLKQRNINIAINAVHPGIVATNIVVNRKTNVGRVIAAMSKAVLISAERGARTNLFLAADEGIKDVSGEYFYRCRIARSSAYSKDEDAAGRLFELSEKLTGTTLDECL